MISSVDMSTAFDWDVEAVSKGYQVSCQSGFPASKDYPPGGYDPSAWGGKGNWRCLNCDSC